LLVCMKLALLLGCVRFAWLSVVVGMSAACGREWPCVE
jgi:hypothetical protein